MNSNERFDALISDMYDELRAREHDRRMGRLQLCFIVAAVIGFVLCAFYQVPIVG